MDTMWDMSKMQFLGLAMSRGLIQAHFYEFLLTKIHETVKNEAKHLKVTGYYRVPIVKSTVYLIKVDY